VGAVGVAGWPPRASAAGAAAIADKRWLLLYPVTAAAAVTLWFTT